MVRRVTGYLFVLLLTAYFFFLYNETVVSGILVFVILYPFISVFYLLAVRKKLEVRMERIPAMGEKGKRIRAGITLKNTAGFTGIRYEAKISVGNRMEKKREHRRFPGEVSGGGTETLWCEFEAGFCGNVEIELEQIRIYDAFGIFFWKKTQREKACVKILPEFDLMPLEITRKTRDFQADAQEYSGERRGDDPTELYQVREYREHDTFRDIHWKLSAKEGTLMVKERGFPLGCVVLVWIDLKEKDRSAAGFSKLIQTTASLSVTLAVEKCIHMAAWYEEKNERVVMWRVHDEESAYQMIWRLLSMEPYREEEKAALCRREAFRGVDFASVVEIDGNGVIRKGGIAQEFLSL